MNAVASFVWTGTLPTVRTHSVAVFTASSSVRIVRATSTSFISGTGLKKWSPSTWPGRLVAAAIAVTLHDEVLVASRVGGGQMRSSLANVSFLSAWFSVIASTTRSQPLRSSKRGVPAMRARMSSLAFASSLPRAASPSSVSRSRPRPFFTSPSLASPKSTEKPAWAATCTMPEPMRPHPMTPTFLMAIREDAPEESLTKGLRAATAGAWRRLEELAARRAVVSDDHGRVAVLDAAVGLDLGGQRRLGRRGPGVTQRLVVGAVTRRRRGLGHVENHRRSDRRLGLVVSPGQDRESQQQSGDQEGARLHATPASSLVISDQRVNRVGLQLIAPAQKDQLDHEGDPDDRAAQLLDQAQRGGHGAAGGQEVVDREHPLAWLDRVLVHGQRVAPVLELARDGARPGRSLAQLADLHDARPQLMRDGAAEDEAARLHADHHVAPLVLIVAGQRVDGEPPRRAVLEQRGDVLEEDAFGREILDVTDLGPEIGDVHVPHTK